MTRPRPGPRRAVPLLFAVYALGFAAQGRAHSASDAYLTLTQAAPAASNGRQQVVLHGQWDIALRDLDFVLRLDDNGDGNITWGELRRHQPQIASYALPTLHLTADGAACQITLEQQLVDDHADGAYASLMFDATCPGAPASLTLQYQLFFAIDPSHRAIVVFRRGENVATSLLSAEQPDIRLPLQ